MSDEDIGVEGDGTGPGVVVWRVGEGVDGGEGDDGRDLGGAVEGERSGALGERRSRGLGGGGGLVAFGRRRE